MRRSPKTIREQKTVSTRLAPCRRKFRKLGLPSLAKVSEMGRIWNFVTMLRGENHFFPGACPPWLVSGTRSCSERAFFAGIHILLMHIPRRTRRRKRFICLFRKGLAHAAVNTSCSACHPRVRAPGGGGVRLPAAAAFSLYAGCLGIALVGLLEGRYVVLPEVVHEPAQEITGEFGHEQRGKGDREIC